MHKLGVQAMDTAKAPPASSLPIFANFDAAHVVIGAGVAIFHLTTSRVVVCYHSKDGYWFLPKGRRDAGEDSGAGAEREGFEEVYLLTQVRCVEINLMVVRLSQSSTSASSSPSPATGS